ncbi:hypothetical protein ACLKA6_000186 [Drosophila palustris]
MPDDTFLVGYADDIAAVITARITDYAQRKLTLVMNRVKNWLDSRGLKLATEKTELLLITRRQIPAKQAKASDGDPLTTKKQSKSTFGDEEDECTENNQRISDSVWSNCDGHRSRAKTNLRAKTSKKSDEMAIPVGGRKHRKMDSKTSAQHQRLDAQKTRRRKLLPLSNDT